MTSPTDWPPYLPRANRNNPSGGARRFGFEIEFHGMDVETAVATLTDALPGTVEQRTPYEYRIETDLGTFDLERDSTWLKELARREAAGETLGVFDRIKQAAGGPMAEMFMPVEVVAPPLRFDQLAELDRLMDAFAAAGAKGTEAEGYYAFGVHVNPEVWSDDAEAIVATVQAFAILQRHLIDVLRVDLARRITPFITPWPDSYVELVVAPDYAPTRDQLIDDYLDLNPTRNRALDMLTLFAHLDEDRVRARVPEQKINARPTYHYRLPNSSIGTSGWRLSGDLRSWALVEQLASSPDLLERACAHMRGQLADSLVLSARVEPDADWLAELHALVDDA